MNSAVLRRITKQLGIYNLTQDAASRLQAEAAEILGMANELERLTKDTPAWFAGTRVSVEARSALEQAEELRHVLEEQSRWRRVFG